MNGFCVGFGYDIHRLVSGRDLVLGGVKIPFNKGLSGHSDADVLIHAIIDALLGAMGERDIGALFPDNDDAYKDISSSELLKKVINIVEEKQFKINNIDSTVILEKPRLNAHIPSMISAISGLIKVLPKQVSIKPKTNEGLGVIGTGDAVACYAVCLLH